MSRIAIVTGGTRGIGEAISLALKAQGVTVVANYAGNVSRAQEFEERTGIRTAQFDVADHETVIKACQQIEADIGPVDIVINNAGITRDGTLMKMSYEDWKKVIDTNLGGCYNMAKYLETSSRNGGSSSTQRTQPLWMLRTNT